MAGKEEERGHGADDKGGGDMMLWLPKGAYVGIGSTAGLGIVDSSYTVECWVRVSTWNTDQQHDNTILATSTLGHFRALHLVLRDRQPYQGHYGPDVRASVVSEKDTWQHYAFVYDVEKREQTVYVDGCEVATASDRAPLQGDVELDIGRYAGTVVCMCVCMCVCDGDVCVCYRWSMAAGLCGPTASVDSCDGEGGGGGEHGAGVRGAWR